MKTLLLKSLTISLFFTLLSCQQNEIIVKESENETVNDMECINKIIDKPLVVGVVKKYIYGEWQLTGMITMLPTEVVPDVKVVFKDILGAPIDKQIAEYYENDKLIGSTLYKLNQVENGEFKWVEIKSDVETFDNEVYNIFRGTIRICENELMIDNGIAYDAPGYLFRRKKN